MIISLECLLLKRRLTYPHAPPFVRVYQLDFFAAAVDLDLHHQTTTTMMFVMLYDSEYVLEKLLEQVLLMRTVEKERRFNGSGGWEKEGGGRMIMGWVIHCVAMQNKQGKLASS